MSSKGVDSGPVGSAPDVDDAESAPATLSTEALIAQYDEERPARSLPKSLDRLVTAYCFVVAVLVVLHVFFPLRQGNQFSLVLFLAATLPLAFLTFRMRTRRRRAAEGAPDVPSVIDWALTALAALVCLYPVLPIVLGDGGGGFNAFLDRQGTLGLVDVVAGAALTVLVLEAARRTTGIVLPIFCIAFLAYAYYGGLLPFDWSISHVGINFDQIINGFFNDASGFYGVPLSVAASYIVLFIIYGAVLSATGADRFFINLSFSAFPASRSAPGRTVVMSGFLLGTVSGSGTATAVTLGSMAWPILKKAGYPRDNAGGILAASGIGAILSPPTLGAAAFIIAEYLQVGYLEVMMWAVVPTILYYVGIFLAVEIDARRFGTQEVQMRRHNPLYLLGRFGYHFVSLGVIIAFLAIGLPPFRAIVYATGVAALFGLVERIVSRGMPLDPHAVPVTRSRAVMNYGHDIYRALAGGIRGSIPVVAVCAAAGIVTSVIVKTGVGLSIAQILVSAGEAASSDPAVVLIVTALLAAFAVIMLGLAVPVTASFIISWVVIGPALVLLGVDAPQVAMFIFYYAVLSEVSPPTALAAVASAAITGGDTIRTMWQATKYTLPAFLAPLAFVLTESGGALLFEGSLGETAWTFAVSLVAVAALAAATGGWIFGRATWIERALCFVGAVLSLYLIAPSIGAGLGLIAIALLVHVARRRARPNHPISASAEALQYPSKGAPRS